MRELKVWTLPLRRWQEEAYLLAKETYVKGAKDFLCVATPGAGKTIFALRVAHYLLYHKYVERIVIVAPTEHLKKQWAESAGLVGIDINPNFENSNELETADFRGISITYAAVGRLPEVYEKGTKLKKTFAIFDEIHHSGDNMSWGDAIRKAFEKAEYRLAISGTPFRRDNNPIPFVKYVNNESKADYIYSYKDALEDGVCRPIYFPAFDGEMKWRYKDIELRATFEDSLNNQLSSQRLKTALDPKGDWLKDVLIDADKKLKQIRSEEHKDAGGLVIAINQTHARKIAKLMEELFSEKPTVVVSDDPSASKKIKKFANGFDKWLVAVKMVSEGVDIPRLRVGVYATNVKSELFFRQAVGRFVRSLKHLAIQDAYLYLPKDPTLVYFAKQIEVERDHKLIKAEISNENFEFRKEKIEAIKEENFEAIYAVATEKFQYELDFGIEFRLPIGAAKKSSIQKKVLSNQKKDVQLQKEEKIEDMPTFEAIEKLRKEIKDLARSVALKRKSIDGKVDWEAPHREWIIMGGKSIEQETLTELKQRKKWLLEQL